MDYTELISFCLQISAMLSLALLFGRIMRRMNQPMIFGELLGGIVLGPTVLGLIAPVAYNWLFTESNSVNIARESLIQLGMLFFLFIAGLEVNLTQVRRQGISVLSTGGLGILFPFCLGAGVVILFPNLWPIQDPSRILPFALLIGTALSISALPVIARILMDLNLIRKDIGQIIMASATLNDLIGWTLFALLLSSFHKVDQPQKNLTTAIMLAICLIIFIFIVRHWIRRGKNLSHHPQLVFSSQIIGIVAATILLSAATAEAIGLHSFFGAFIVGVVLAQSIEKHAHIKEIISRFTLSFFAPIYFVSIGLKADFIADFDFLLVIMIVAIAIIGKVFGAGLGALIAGVSPRKAIAIGFGLNARGAIEMILASLALKYNLIDKRVFVGLIIMALITSMLSGPMLRHLLRDKPAKKRIR